MYDTVQYDSITCDAQKNVLCVWITAAAKMSDKEGTGVRSPDIGLVRQRSRSGCWRAQTGIESEHGAGGPS